MPEPERLFRGYEIAKPISYAVSSPEAGPSALGLRTLEGAEEGGKRGPYAEDWDEPQGPDRTTGTESANLMDSGERLSRHRRSEKRPEEVTREKRAIWVVHGMGQQIPFETLDDLARD